MGYGFTVQDEDNRLVVQRPELGRIDDEKRIAFLTLLTKHGFVYMPYESTFNNPFIGMYFKLEVFAHTLDGLAKRLAFEERMSAEALEKAIEGYYAKIDSWRWLRMFVGGSSLVYGTITYAVAVALWFVTDWMALPSLVGQIFGICAVHAWISFQHLTARFQGRWEVAGIYARHELAIKLMRLLFIAISVILFYLKYDGIAWWAVLGSLVLASLITNALVMKCLRLTWWGFHGLGRIKDLYVVAD